MPVDAIGFQCHFTLNQIPDTLQQNLQRFADLGLDVAITELDINLDGPGNATALQQQAENYWTVVDACMMTNRCVSVVSDFVTPTTSFCLYVLILPDCRVFGVSQMIIRGFRMERCYPGTQRSSPNRHSTRLLMRLAESHTLHRNSLFSVYGGLSAFKTKQLKSK